MYQALYRKYRSQTFGEMVGQKVISTTLSQAKSAMPISFLAHVVLVRRVQQKFLPKQ